MESCGTPEQGEKQQLEDIWPADYDKLNNFSLDRCGGVDKKTKSLNKKVDKPMLFIQKKGKIRKAVFFYFSQLLLNRG